MKNNIVNVILWGKEICKLQWQGGYKNHFGKVGSLISFNKHYSEYGFDVDPLGPYRSSVYMVQKGLSDICRATEYEGLPRFLSGSLPDDWGNQVFSSWIENNDIRSSDVTPVDKLAFIGKRGIGGFEFIPELYTPSSENTIVLEELYSLAKDIEATRDGFILNLKNKTEIKDLMEVGMSAGGKHPKAIVAIDWTTGEIRSGQIPLPNSFTHYILKFKDSDTWPTAEIEYVYYQMAKESGIEMEKSSLLQAGGVNHFLTERFDRKNNKKIHSATLRALCGEISAYEDIFRACRRLHLPYQDIEQLFRRAVFNFLTCVCDDHDKNFSFTLTEDGIWRLSPAYDVTFTANFKNLFIADKHNMSIDGHNRGINRIQFIKLAEQNDIKRASDIIDEISEVALSFETKADKTGIGKRYVDIIKESINTQIQALPI